MAVTFLDVINTAIWPVLLIIFFWPLRGKLEGDWAGFRSWFKGRSFTAEIPGAKLSTTTVQAAVEAQREQAPEDGAILETKQSAPSTEGGVLPPSEREIVNLFEAELKQVLDATPADERIPHLLRAFAFARIQGTHEWVYNRIFGSQIAFVRRLNEMERSTIDQAKQFFSPFAEQFPNVYTTYGFDGWRTFLTANNLIKETAGLLEMTPYGRDFLKFLVDARLPDAKAF